MPDEKLVPPRGNDDTSLPVEERWAPPRTPGGYAEPYYGEDSAEAGIDWRRYVYAVARYKWLVVAATFLGAAGGYFAWGAVEPEYTAQGSLWVEVSTRAGAGDVSPIRQSGLLESNAWIELLRTYAVLDTVVLQERLYLRYPREYAAAFEDFGLADRYAPGDFRLTLAESGELFRLATDFGGEIQRGTLGDSIGAEMGFRWVPDLRSYPPGTEIPFTVLPLRDAGRRLDGQLVTSMDRAGNFIRISLAGTNPQRITDVLNAVMERHVQLAADLKRSKLDETLVILEEQLTYAEEKLARAEDDLERFRVRTITLPSDASTPIAPGLEVTRDPVFNSFFQMNVDVGQLRRDRERLEEVVRTLPQAGVQIEALEAIPAVAASTEMTRVLGELVDARAGLRALRDRYSDEYPPVQDVLTRIASLEGVAVPQGLDRVLGELRVRESEMQGRITSASQELSSIPPRTIEEARLTRRVAIQETLYNELRSRVETARLAAASSIPDVQILDRATVPVVPTNDRRVSLAAVIFMGLIGGSVGLAILLDRMDARFRYPAEVTRDMGLEILASIPRIESGKRGPDALTAAQALEAFRELRVQIGFAYGSAGPLTLTITSPSEGEGKSFISANLAVAFAQMGRRTLLIDADTRRGDVHHLLGARRVPGLTDYLRDRTGKDIIQNTEFAHLDFVGCGTRGTSTPELLASRRMAEFLGTMKRAYEVILVDSPPLASGGDPVVLSSLTGNLVLVIRTGSTEKQLAAAKLEMLSRLPLRVLGAILNDVEQGSATYRYYHSYYLPGYAPGEEDEERDGGAATRLLSGTSSTRGRGQAS